MLPPPLPHRQAPAALPAPFTAPLLQLQFQLRLQLQLHLSFSLLLLVFVALSGLAATFAVLFVARRILYPYTHSHTHSLSVCAGVSKCRFAGVTFTVYATLASHVLSTKTSITFSRPGPPYSFLTPPHCYQIMLVWYYTYSPWTRRWCASPAWMVLMAKVFLQNRIESNNQVIINYVKINKTSF